MSGGENRSIGHAATFEPDAFQGPKIQPMTTVATRRHLMGATILRPESPGYPTMTGHAPPTAGGW